MHLLLTDRLCCPRCGPEFGLILLSDHLEDRRVHEGGLGCSNCRDSYPVRGGVADLRAIPRGPLSPDPAGHGSPEKVTPAEVGALLGVLRGPGHLLVLGALVAHARALADLIEGIEVVAGYVFEPDGVEESGVSRVVVRGSLPFKTRSLRGVALFESEEVCDLAEVSRVISPGGRLALFATRPGAGERVRAQGLEIIAEETGRVVACR